MSHPPVVVVESGGVPRTQVAEGGSAPAFTVVESGARPITLADNSPPIALFNPDGTPYTGGGVPSISQTPFSLYRETLNAYEKFWQASSAAYDYSILRSNNGKVVHFKFEPGDKAPDDGTVDRSELTAFNESLPLGSEFWIVDNFMVEPVSAEYPSLDINSICHLGQLHTDSSGSPIVAWRLYGDTELTVVTRSGSSGSPVAVTQYTDSAFERGRSYARVQHIKTGASGIYEAWVDGVKVADYAGAIEYTDRTETYWKFGIYRSVSATGAMGAFYWNFQWSDDDLSAYIGNPEPYNPGSTFRDMWKIDYIGRYSDTADALSYSFSDIPVSAEQFDRYLFIALSYTAVAAQDVTSITVQPKTAEGDAIGSPMAITVHRAVSTGASTVRVIVGSVLIPEGVLFDVAATADGTLNNCNIDVARVQGIMSNTSIDEPGSTSATPTLAHNGHGMVFAIAIISSAGQTATWAGATKQGVDNTPEGSLSISCATAKLVDDSVLEASLVWTGGSGARAALTLHR